MPRNDESDEPVLCENILFKKEIYEKDAQGKKEKKTASEI